MSFKLLHVCVCVCVCFESVHCSCRTTPTKTKCRRSVTSVTLSPTRTSSSTTKIFKLRRLERLPLLPTADVMSITWPATTTQSPKRSCPSNRTSNYCPSESSRSEVEKVLGKCHLPKGYSFCRTDADDLTEVFLLSIPD